MSMIGRIDDALYQLERAVVGVMLAVMGSVVFLDVMFRATTRVGSPLSYPIVIALLFAVLGTAAFHTRGEDTALGKGLVVGVVVATLQAIFVRVFPNGLVWSQTLALALTLWLGTIGASLAAHDRRHLAMDIGSKLWPAWLVPKVAAAGHIATALFAFLLVGLSLLSVRDHWANWGDGGGNLAGLPIPLWFPAASVPYGMTVVGLRFLREAWRTLNGEIDLGGDDTLHQLGIDEPTGTPQ